MSHSNCGGLRALLLYISLSTTRDPHVVCVGQKAFVRPKTFLAPDRKSGKRRDHVVLIPRICTLRAQREELLERDGRVAVVDPYVGVEARRQGLRGVVVMTLVMLMFCIV